MGEMTAESGIAHESIKYSRNQAQRHRLYRELIAVTRATLDHLQQAVVQLARVPSLAAAMWRAQVEHYHPLIARIIEQGERRVLRGEAVPAREKLVSLFEPHADIIVKGGRDVHYGHKLNLTTGRSGLILDVVDRDWQSGRQRALPADARTPDHPLRSRHPNRVRAILPAWQILRLRQYRVVPPGPASAAGPE